MQKNTSNVIKLYHTRERIRRREARLSAHTFPVRQAAKQTGTPSFIRWLREVLQPMS